MANRLGPTEEVNGKLEHIQVSCKPYVAYWEAIGKLFSQLRRQMANYLGPTEEVNGKLEHIEVSCKLFGAYWEGYRQTVLAD